MPRAALAILAAVVTVATQPHPSRPPVYGLAHVRLLSSDLSKARRFYGDLLGFAEITPTPANTAIFRVNDRQRIIVQSGLPPERDDRLVDVAWETADVAAMRRLLAARSVQARDVSESGEGHAIELDDPDGHRTQLVQLSSQPAAQGEVDHRISRRMLHAGLTIRDAPSADRFYRDVLGFSEIWRGGRPEGVVNWINMRVPEGTDYLEYMLTPTPPDRRRLGTAHHIALLVTDIQAALETVRARSAAGEANHAAVPQIGVNRRWQLNVYDPDGTRIEFMEPWTVR